MHHSDDIETDDRFSTGEWRGFYMQPDGARRYRMDFVLEFSGGRMTGQGDDPVGPFGITGSYETDSGQCRWVKQYVGQHEVQYSGQARSRGIVGEWTIVGQPAFWTGPFFIWPRAAGDPEALFEAAFVESALSVPQSLHEPQSSRTQPP